MLSKFQNHEHTSEIVYLGNLPREWNKWQVLYLCQWFGDVTTKKISYDSCHGKNQRKYAIVEFSSITQAQSAINSLNCSMVCDYFSLRMFRMSATYKINKKVSDAGKVFIDNIKLSQDEIDFLEKKRYPLIQNNIRAEEQLFQKFSNFGEIYRIRINTNFAGKPITTKEGHYTAMIWYYRSEDASSVSKLEDFEMPFINGFQVTLSSKKSKDEKFQSEKNPTFDMKNEGNLISEKAQKPLLFS
jgi:hypothetical protein